MAEESTKQDAGDSRRHSTGKILSSKSVEIVPHYLRASTGSCHDFCKYGRKEAVEEKEICSLRVAPRRLSMATLVSRKSSDGVVLPKRKNISVTKLSRSHESEILLPDIVTIAKQAKLQSADRKNSIGNEHQNKLSLVKFKTPTKSKPPSSSVLKNVKQEAVPSPEKPKVSTKKGWAKLKDKDLSTKHVISLKPKSLATKELSAPNILGGSKAISSISKGDNQRKVTSLKINSLAAKKLSSLDASGGLNGLRKSELKLGKKPGTTLVSLKKVCVPPTGSLSPKPSLRRVASVKTQNMNVKVTPLKNQNKIREDLVISKDFDNEETPEKTLYVIKIETENKPLEFDQDEKFEGPSPSSSSSSSSCKSVPLPNSTPLSPHDAEELEYEYTMTETEEDDSFSEDSEVDDKDNAEIIDEDHKGKPMKSGTICSEDVESHPLKFRRGKVVDMQFENEKPRRLKFRRGKVLGEHENVKTDNHRRRYKKRECVNDDATGTEAAAEKVVLRHQDVQGKKDDTGLFNNVIEETASKLVESRKSKVKALVGAFETVISLQERKPSANYIS